MNKITFPLEEFYFLRHSQTDWNRRHIYMGRQNICLNETGIQEAQKAKRLMNDYPFKSIACSPLDRAAQTAKIINHGKLQNIHIIEELKEACWGVMEGRAKEDDTWMRDWQKGAIIEEAEQYSHFKQRVMEGLNQALSLPGPVLIVSHGGVYWAIQELLNIPFNDIANATPVYHRPPVDNASQWFACSLGDE